MVNNHSDDSQARLGILKALGYAGGSFISGESLSRTFGVSRTSIWKHVQALRGQGYGVESVTRHGYRLVSCPDSLTSLEVKRQLNSRIVGREVYCFDSVSSTQDTAFRMAEEGAVEGTVVVAAQQDEGRGRLGRSFFSPEGGLWFSIIFRPPLKPEACLPVSLMAGVAVRDAIDTAMGLPAVLKWPNDILVNGKKVCGILSEIVAETDAVHFIVCGIGLNVNVTPKSFPAELRPIATSLQAELGHQVSCTTLLCRVLEDLDRCYLEMLRSGPATAIAAWRAAPNIIGARVKLTAGEEVIGGKAAALDDDGALLVETRDGAQRRVVFGDVGLVGI